MNKLDQIISYFSPNTARQRVQNRVMLNHLVEHSKKTRRFEAASKGNRVSGWHTSSGSINEMMRQSLQTIVDRSRYLGLNNSYAKRGIKAIAGHTVGAGIVPQIKKASSKTEELFKEWSESLDIDADGRHDLYGLQYLVMKTVVESGECLVRKRLRPKSFGLKFPLQLQVIEPDYLDTSKGVMGVEFDKNGKRSAYWLYDSHPKESKLRLVKSFRIPASEILHVFETHRAGQVRGFPWLAPCILRLNDLDDYESAQLTRQKMAACLVGVITDKDGESSEEEIDKDDFGLMEPGSFEILPAGKTIEFSNPPAINGYSEYMISQLHAVAAGLELPYIILANDYSKVSFSSSRMAFMEFYRSIEHWRWHMMVPQFCNPAFKWFVDTAILSGKINGKPPRATWVPPKREFIDPKKEIEANILDVRAGFISQSEMIRSRGYDPEEVYEEIAADHKRFDELKITVTTDARNDIKKGAR